MKRTIAATVFFALAGVALALPPEPDPARPGPGGDSRDTARLISAGMGFQNGYLDGYDLGANDFRFRGRSDIQTSPLFQKADRGYSDKWRYYVVYQRAYREGFARGYSEGYAEKPNILIDRFYDLEETLRESAAAPPEPPSRPIPRGPVVLPAGTRIMLELNDYLTTKMSDRGDPFSAIVSSDVFVGNVLALPETTLITGHVGRVAPPSRGRGRAELNLDFESLKLPDGTEMPLAATLTGVGPSSGSVRDEEGTVQGKSTAGRDAATVAGTTAGGAVIGGIAGGGKGAGIGVLIGGLVGLAGVMSSKGADIELIKGTVIEITLDEDLRIDRAPRNSQRESPVRSEPVESPPDRD